MTLHCSTIGVQLLHTTNQHVCQNPPLVTTEAAETAALTGKPAPSSGKPPAPPSTAITAITAPPSTAPTTTPNDPTSLGGWSLAVVTEQLPEGPVGPLQGAPSLDTVSYIDNGGTAGGAAGGQQRADPTALPRHDSMQVQQQDGSVKKWPACGTVRFDGVWMKYAPTAPYALRGVSFDIQHSEKVYFATCCCWMMTATTTICCYQPHKHRWVWLVARALANPHCSWPSIACLISTKAASLWMGWTLPPYHCGRYAVASPLFRRWVYDGGMCCSVLATFARFFQGFSTHPPPPPDQEPVVFSGTVRSNLDPFLQHPDARLWEVLRSVRLDATVASVGGLDAAIDGTGGQAWSLGEQQLVCLARAALKSVPVLCLDEATASMDPHTEAAVVEIIDQLFAERTTLTIAHRCVVAILCIFGTTTNFGISTRHAQVGHGGACRQGAGARLWACRRVCTTQHTLAHPWQPLWGHGGPHGPRRRSRNARHGCRSGQDACKQGTSRCRRPVHLFAAPFSVVVCKFEHRGIHGRCVGPRVCAFGGLFPPRAHVDGGEQRGERVAKKHVVSTPASAV